MYIKIYTSAIFDYDADCREFSITASRLAQSRRPQIRAHPPRTLIIRSTETNTELKFDFLTDYGKVCYYCRNAEFNFNLKVIL